MSYSQAAVLVVDAETAVAVTTVVTMVVAVAIAVAAIAADANLKSALKKHISKKPVGLKANRLFHFVSDKISNNTPFSCFIVHIF